MIHVDVMPALGTHAPMNQDQFRLMFGQEIPFERILHHRWREDIDRLGEIRATEIEELSIRSGHSFGERSANEDWNASIFAGQSNLIDP